MNVDTDSLERLNLLTRDAAERAGTALSEAIDAETTVGATKIRLVNREDIVTDLLGETGACLKVDLTGLLSGAVLVTIDAGALGEITGALGDGTEAVPPAVHALTDAMMDGFVADWESHLGDDLAVTSPVHIEHPESHAFDFETTGRESESIPVFQSEIRWLDAAATVRLFLVPDRGAMERLLAIDDPVTDDAATGPTIDSVTDSPEQSDDTTPDGQSATRSESDDGDETFGTGDESPFGGGETAGLDADGSEQGTDAFDGDGNDGAFGMGGGDISFADEETRSLPLEKLSVFSDLTREGTGAAAERVTQMTGIETETEISGVSFTPIDDISGQLAGGEYVGTTVEFEGTPSGYLVILFRERSAVNIAEAMLPTDPEGDGLTDMHESALEELCNIMSSGFIDGWANVLQTSVEHTPPEFVDDMDLAMVEVITDQLGPFQTHAYTIESRMRTEAIDFDCEIHALPSESGLGEALEELLVERKHQTEADPSDVF